MPVESAHIPVWTDETGRIQDPAFNQCLKLGQFPWIEITGSAQSMQIAIGIETQLRRAVITRCQFLAGITERLEVANGLPGAEEMSSLVRTAASVTSVPRKGISVRRLSDAL